MKLQLTMAYMLFIQSVIYLVRHFISQKDNCSLEGILKANAVNKEPGENNTVSSKD